MKRVSSTHRVLLALLTAGQLALPAAVVLADTWTGVPPGLALVQAPARPDGGQQRAHSDDCVFCRFLAHVFTPLATLVRLPAAAEAECPSAPVPVRYHAATVVSSPRARSPPLDS